MDEDSSAIIQAAAKTWYGYGQWSAPFWFVGMEQGGDPEGQSYLVWKELGGGELLDCREHHLAIDDPLFRRWHEGATPRTQPTWRGLIQILLAYQGSEAATDEVRKYQTEKWGSSKGETAVIELSALRARNLATNIARLNFRAERVQTIHDRLVEHRPVFVVCYGLGYRADYERLAGGAFDQQGFLTTGKTVFALTKHPTSFGVRKDQMLSFGRDLRHRVENLALMNRTPSD